MKICTRTFTISTFLACILFGPIAAAQQDKKTADAKTKTQQPSKINDNPLAHVKKTDKPNGLIDETSPYLLMHAYNPVQWYPWNAETLAKAKKENKPIFLSVGYSSCHWCHVMERESFMDKDIAEYLNKHFICVKVDREERPDIDSIYMTSLMVYNRASRSGGGTGWPLSMFLTPDAKPFFGGTYFPARDGDRGARVGFLTLINRIENVWKNKTDQVLKDANLISEMTQKELDGTLKSSTFKLDKKIIKETVNEFSDVYDEQWGGFGFNPRNPKVPKFPQPANLVALYEAARQSDNQSAKKMLVHTLEKMYLGGMYDHLGGGFHRYSVDRYWRIPHFEKMLYDNGQLASLYANASVLTGRQDFADVARGICDFIIAEMTGAGGGFYSALDAESEGEEGKFNRWSQTEIKNALGDAGYRTFAPIYQIDKNPNFEGKYYVPQLDKTVASWATQKSVTAEKLQAELAPLRKRLFDIRARRPRPLTDTKILSSWNGLMIRGMADTGRVLKEPRYIAAAEKAADFVNTQLRNDQGRLLRTYRNDKAKLNAYLDDYAFFIDALIALHQATKKQKWLDLANELQKKQDELFWDDKRGGYFFTSSDHESLLARAKNPTDGARPSGNSISALNLIYLSQKLDQPAYRDRAREIVETFSRIIERSPRAVPLLSVVANRLLETEPKEQR